LQPSRDLHAAVIPIRTGGGDAIPEGVGTVRKLVKAGNRWRILTLNNVYRCPGFTKNIPSLQKLYAPGDYLEGLNLIGRDGNVVGTLDDDFISRPVTLEKSAVRRVSKISIWRPGTQG
jgi:hypothetical protein